MANPPQAPATLGDVLYARPSAPALPEADWVALVRSVASGEPAALHALYDRAHRLVFTMIMRLVSNRERAEQLTVEVFHDLWRRAAAFDTASGTVLGWIMNQARFRAIERLRRDARNRQGDPGPDAALLTLDTPDFRDLLHAKDRSRVLREALAALTAEERNALESAYFCERAGGAPARLRPALHKLQQALRATDASTRPGTEASACDSAEAVCALAVHALSGAEAQATEAHLASCWQCRRELEALRPVVEAFTYWPTDVLRPPAELRSQLAQSVHPGEAPPPRTQGSRPPWEEVAPGISCKLLACDAERERVSMLVRLAPGGEYPPHTHAGVEELHLLSGELWIDERKLYPGDYNRAEAGTGDKRVWSETGCTCVLITSTRDALG